MSKNMLLLLMIASLTFSGYAQNGKLRTKHFNLTKGVAIGGYDPVAYFKQQKAIKGSDQFTENFNGVVYHFSSAENEAEFKKYPVQYEPQYGGWCAFAMGDYGKKVEIDPETFKVVEGKLYLFYNAFFTNTLKSWNKDEKNLKHQADKNWMLLYK